VADFGNVDRILTPPRRMIVSSEPDRITGQNGSTGLGLSQVSFGSWPACTAAL
jgi:hypothetical protein